MRSAQLLCIAAVAVLSGGAAPASGQTLPMPAEHHPWGHFPAGSWKSVRATSETLDAKGQVANITLTDTKTTLVAVDESSYTLRSEITVDVSGRRIATTPQLVKYGYYGETPGQGLSVKKLGDTTLTIDGQAIPCELRQVVVESNGGKLLSTLHYSTDVEPFVLRRETSLEGASEEKRNSSLVEVVALDLPQRVRGELKQSSYVKTTQKLPQGTKVTLEVHCDDVPGAVVAHWASETDTSGKLVRRSTLELTGYALAVPVSGQPLVFPRRMHRATKTSRRMDQR